MQETRAATARPAPARAPAQPAAAVGRLRGLQRARGNRYVGSLLGRVTRAQGVTRLQRAPAPAAPAAGQKPETKEQKTELTRDIFDQMKARTKDFMPAVCDRGRLPSVKEHNLVSEAMADAFGHCWIACHLGRTGVRRRGAWILGTGYELGREWLFGGPHNSLSEDYFNQSIGRRLSEKYPCVEACTLAAEAGMLRMHLGAEVCFTCEDKDYHKCSPPERGKLFLPERWEKGGEGGEPPATLSLDEKVRMIEVVLTGKLRYGNLETIKRVMKAATPEERKIIRERMLPTVLKLEKDDVWKVNNALAGS
jgi:hypothetical protein